MNIQKILFTLCLFGFCAAEYGVKSRIVKINYSTSAGSKLKQKLDALKSEILESETKKIELVSKFNHLNQEAESFLNFKGRVGGYLTADGADVQTKLYIIQSLLNKITN